MFLALAGSTLAQEAILGEVSVTAQSGAQEMRRNSAGARIVVDRQELEALDAANVGELLRKLPGTGAIPDPDSRRGRGKGPDKLMPQILVDGQPLPGGDRNPATALRLSADLIERIEIIRNGSAEFPGAGPGGTINIVLRDVPPKASRNIRLGAGASAGEPLLRAEGQQSERLGDFGYLLSGSVDTRPTAGHRETGIQRFAGGNRSEWTLEKADESGRNRNLTLSPRFDWNLGGGRQFIVSPFLSHSEDDRSSRIERRGYADPVGGSGLAALGEDHERQETRRTSGRLSAEWKESQPGKGELSARVTLQGETERSDRQLRRFDTAGLLTAATGEATERQESEGSLMLRGKRLLGESHVLTGGADWRRKAGEEENRINGATRARAELDDTRQALWVQDEWQLAEQHLLTPGLRWQYQQSRIEDNQGSTANAYRSLDPSLHYLWQPDPAWNLRASLARSGKAPFTRELSPVVRSASGANTSANPDRAGNPNLDLERTLGLEAGVEHFLAERQGSVGFSVFRREVSNQVQRLIQLEGGRWVERPYNVGDALLRGGLLDFKLKANALSLPALTLRGNAGYTHIQLVDPAPGLGAGEGPRRTATLGFDYDIPSQRLTLGGTFTYTSALDRESSATVRQTQGLRRQLDLYALQKIDRQLSLRYSIQNATRPERTNDLRETDLAGSPTRLERDRDRGAVLFMVTLEGKW